MSSVGIAAKVVAAAVLLFLLLDRQIDYRLREWELRHDGRIASGDDASFIDEPQLLTQLQDDVEALQSQILEMQRQMREQKEAPSRQGGATTTRESSSSKPRDLVSVSRRRGRGRQQHPHKQTRKMAHRSLMKKSDSKKLRDLTKRVTDLTHNQQLIKAQVSPIGRCLRSVSYESQFINRVIPSDTILVKPNRHNGPLIAPITAYNWNSNAQFPAEQYERPIYKRLSRNEDGFWLYVVDELLLARVDVVMLHGRGCSHPVQGDEGPGNMCPRLLRKFVAAVQAANAMDVIRAGMFDATGAYPRNAGVERLDLAQPSNWHYFWMYNIEIWFDTVPRTMWYLLDGQHPVIASWTLSSAFFQNQEGNASRLLKWLQLKFHQRYGMTPAFILQETWFKEDSTITAEHAMGKHRWFSPEYGDFDSTHSYTEFNGRVWGVTTPGYRNGYSFPNCTSDCRFVGRQNGKTLYNALEAGLHFPMENGTTTSSTLTLLEGWTDMVESAGFYRSDHWEYPSQYINIVRSFADPEPETLRFQAEGADAFFDTSDANEGNRYANRSLDVGALKDGSGWYVGWSEEGEWLEYQHVQLGCGRYRFTARVSSRQAGKQLRLAIYPGSNETDGEALVEFPIVTVGETGGLDSYILVHLGQVKLQAQSYNLRIVTESKGLNIDWFFLKRASDCYCLVDDDYYVLPDDGIAAADR